MRNRDREPDGKLPAINAVFDKVCLYREKRERERERERPVCLLTFSRKWLLAAEKMPLSSYTSLAISSL